MPIPASFVLIHDGRRFLAHVRGQDRKIGIAGGKQERGETLLTTAIRETKEEYGIILPETELEYRGYVVNENGRQIHLYEYRVRDVEELYQTVKGKRNRREVVQLLMIRLSKQEVERLKDSLHNSLYLQLKELVFGEDR